MQLRRTKFLFTKACSFAAVRKTTEDKIGNNFYCDSKKIAYNHCLGIIILYSTELLSILERCATVSGLPTGLLYGQITRIWLFRKPVGHENFVWLCWLFTGFMRPVWPAKFSFGFYVAIWPFYDISINLHRNFT
jgi:hypothetical protein